MAKGGTAGFLIIADGCLVQPKPKQLRIRPSEAESF